MGILDDLAMGFGLKERTEDYDARTARNIAVSDATRNISNDFERTKMQTRLRNDPNLFASMYGSDYSNYTRRTPMGQPTSYSPSRQYLDRQARGRENYNPSIVQNDDRSFMQRALYSPESPASPTPYGIGPMQFDEPLPAFGMMGLIKALAGGGKKKQAAPMSTFDSSYNMGSLIPRMSADEGEITDEELAGVTGEDTLGTFTPEEMETADLLTELNARFDATGDDPTVGIDRQPLYDAGYSDGFIDRLTQDDRNKIFAMHVGKAFR